MSDDAAATARPGRASGAATKQAIGRAARQLFGSRGYAGASVRAIAAAAGVDPALVIRYYGSKEHLFLASMPIVGRFDHITSGPLDGFGDRLVTSLLTERTDLSFGIWRAVIRATDSALVRARLTEAVEQMFVAPLAPRLVGPEPELRARLIAAQVSGLLDAVAVLEDPRLQAASTATLAGLYGTAIQALVDVGAGADDTEDTEVAEAVGDPSATVAKRA